MKSKMKTDMKNILLSLCALGALTACGPDTPPANQTDMPDEGTPDVVEDMPEDMPDEDVPDVCVGESVCPDNACGTWTNECGDEIACEPCLCQGGQPTIQTCGVCDLGTPTCAPDDTFSCTLPEIPGLTQDVCGDRVVYVSRAPVESDRDGSRDRPFDSVERAIKVAQGSGAVAVLIQGNETYEEVLEVVSGVSVIAGFGPGWKYDETIRPTFAPTSTTGDQFGMLAQDIVDVTLVANVLVQAPAGMDPGSSSIGLQAVDARALTLQGVVLRAGAGAPGAPGVDGMAGASGLPGEDAPTAFCDGLQPFPGGGGVNAACTQADGGSGGRGLAGQQDAKDGGTSPAGTRGGQAGTTNSPDGRSGNAGALISGPGANGPGGKSGAMWMGDRLVPQGTGVSGLRGLDGPGGGGGGGSHSNTWETFTCRGSAGGGGGAGGCGGGAGTGGGAGGSSIGALLVRSPVTFEATRVIAELGGRGGRGGQGALGGQGATGGQGAAYKSNGGVIRASDHTGGDGGRGADGLAGGHGGGGAGGVAVGIWCERSTPVLGETVELDMPATASGGQSAGSPGEEGLSARSFQCP